MLWVFDKLEKKFDYKNINLKQMISNNSKAVDKINLNLNENMMGCSLKVIEALRKISNEDISKYPNYETLLSKLSCYLNVNANQLLLTNGADNAITLIMDTYLNKDEKVIIPIPTFHVFLNFAELKGFNKKLVSYHDDLTFPTDEIIDEIDEQTKLVIIVNPNNPTGSLIPQEDIIKIVEKSKKSIVLIDEAYFQFSGQSSKDLINKYSNVIIIQTFSKGFGLAGLRIGYIIANSDIINKLNKNKLPFEVNTISTIAASAALNDIDFVNHYVEIINQNKKYLQDELTKLGFKTYKSHTNFILASFGEKSDFVLNQLNERNIKVKDLSYNKELKGCIRITIGTKHQMEKFVDELKDILSYNY